MFEKTGSSRPAMMDSRQKDDKSEFARRGSTLFIAYSFLRKFSARILARFLSVITAIHGPKWLPFWT
jgi:hypothetical protein